MSDRAAVRLVDVGFRYPGASVPALDAVSFEVAKGGFLAVLGPNGAGKSTLVRLIAGSLRPATGTVEVLGRAADSWERSRLARSLAVVAQEAPPSGIPLTVQAYVELGRNPYVSPWAALGPRDRAVVDAALERAALVEFRERPLSSLSGGERQRAKVARALAQEPEVLLLDEPTVHLDVRHGLWAFEALRELTGSDGVTAICITHDLNLASRFADRVALLGRGRLLGFGPPAEVLDSASLSRAYECELRVERVEGLGRFVLPVRSGSPAGSPA